MTEIPLKIFGSWIKRYIRLVRLRGPLSSIPYHVAGVYKEAKNNLQQFEVNNHGNTLEWSCININRAEYKKCRILSTKEAKAMTAREKRREPAALSCCRLNENLPTISQHTCPFTEWIIIRSSVLAKAARWSFHRNRAGRNPVSCIVVLTPYRLITFYDDCLA